MLLTRTDPSLWTRDALARIWDRPEMPKLEGFSVHYGVMVSDIGEDGDLVALGHVGLLRALAAFNRHARKVWGARHLCEWEFGSREARVVERIAHSWMTNDAPLDDWVMRPADGPHVYGAFPVTYFTA
jgi:hypothetical protein